MHKQILTQIPSDHILLFRSYILKHVNFESDFIKDRVSTKTEKGNHSRVFCTKLENPERASINLIIYIVITSSFVKSYRKGESNLLMC